MRLTTASDTISLGELHRLAEQLRSSEPLIETVALRLASIYHGRECSRDYVLSDSTGGHVFVEMAREAIKLILS
jgi:hypothetical protein